MLHIRPSSLTGDVKIDVRDQGRDCPVISFDTGGDHLTIFPTREQMQDLANKINLYLLTSASPFTFPNYPVIPIREAHFDALKPPTFKIEHCRFTAENPPDVVQPLVSCPMEPEGEHEFDPDPEIQPLPLEKTESYF